MALARLNAAGVSHAELQSFFADCLVRPLLTAHPTEVRRRSTIDPEMEVASSLAVRNSAEATPEELAADSEALRRAHVLADEHCPTRLAVVGEVENELR
jgi:phosphoenolpyruvate carboxylase